MDANTKKPYNSETKDRSAMFLKKRNEFLMEAAEFCAESGSEIAILMTSKDGTVESYGHPNVDKVLDQFLDGSNNEVDTNILAPVWENDNKVATNDQRFEDVSTKMVKLLVAAKCVDQNIEIVDDDGRFWWDKSVDEMGLKELKLYVEAAEELKDIVVTKLKERSSSQSTEQIRSGF